MPAQSALEASISHKLSVDSQWLDNRTNADRVVFQHVVRVKDAPWMRLFFSQPNLPKGSFLRLTSLLDQAVQRLDAHSIVDYGNASCYFNGEAVRLELVAGPNTRANRVQIVSVAVGVGTVETICGSVDDRRQSFDKRGCRFNGGCSAWLFTNNAVGTAGHCGNNSNTNLLEFNVPRSTSGGGRVRSHPDDQYPTIAGSGGRSTGFGNDWMVMRTGRNSNTGRFPGVAQGGYYCLGTVPTRTAGNNIRITGYGSSSVRVLNLVQKTHVGPLYRLDGSTLRYRTDTTGGNSGSPVIHENTGMVVGVHTHGGCRSSGTNNGNAGTRIDRPAFQAAIRGLIGRAGTSGIYGSGCSSSGGTPAHSIVGAPNIGRSVSVRTANLPPNAKGFLVLGATQVNRVVGNCRQLASADILVGLDSNASGVAQLAVPIPNDTCFVGVTMYSQQATDDNGQIVTSNGARTSIGYQ